MENCPKPPFWTWPGLWTHKGCFSPQDLAPDFFRTANRGFCPSKILWWKLRFVSCFSHVLTVSRQDLTWFSAKICCALVRIRFSHAKSYHETVVLFHQLLLGLAPRSGVAKKNSMKVTPDLAAKQAKHGWNPKETTILWQDLVWIKTPVRRAKKSLC